MTTETTPLIVGMMAEAFYQAKVPDGRWESIPHQAKESYISAMEAAYKVLEKEIGKRI